MNTENTAPVETAEDKEAAKAAAAAAKAEAKAAKEAERAAAKAAKEAERAAAKAKREEEKAAAKAAKEAEKQAAKEAKERAKAEAAAAREANRMPEQNGVRRPKPDTLCGRAWGIFDQVSQKNGSPASIGESMEIAKADGLNEANVRAEYARWRKFHGISGRIEAPKTEQSTEQSAAA